MTSLSKGVSSIKQMFHLLNLRFMPQPIYAFVFPFEGGGEFRCKRNFPDAESAANWAVEIILKEGDDFCYFKEVASSDYVFEPACESHTVVRWLDDEDAPTIGQYEMYDVID